jgi:hypothetical protein
MSPHHGLGRAIESRRDRHELLGHGVVSGSNDERLTTIARLTK